MLFLPSLEIKAPRYLKWSLCLSLMPLIVMLMSGGSSLRLITITSVFLLFSSSPFSLLFDSTMFRSCCRSFSFSEIRTVSSAYLNGLKLFVQNKEINVIYIKNRILHEDLQIARSLV